MSGSACTWKYLSISSLHQKTISLIMFLSTPEHRRAMAPAAQRDQADMPLDYNPRFDLQRHTEVLMVFDIMVGVMFFHLPARIMIQASGVEGGSPWDIS